MITKEEKEIHYPLKKILKEKRLSQVRLANDVGVSKTFMYELVSERKNCSPALFEKIKEALEKYK